MQPSGTVIGASTAASALRAPTPPPRISEVYSQENCKGAAKHEHSRNIVSYPGRVSDEPFSDALQDRERDNPCQPCRSASHSHFFR